MRLLAKIISESTSGSKAVARAVGLAWPACSGPLRKRPELDSLPYDPKVLHQRFNRVVAVPGRDLLLPERSQGVAANTPEEPEDTMRIAPVAPRVPSKSHGDTGRFVSYLK